MQYSSPFHLFPKLKNESFQNEDFRRLRKETMLRFELKNTTTITLEDGRTYDRNGVQEIFQSLEEEWPFHWQVFQNKPLLNFLETGDMAFFAYPNAEACFKETAFRVWVEPFFQEQLSKFYYNCVRQPTRKSIDQLKFMKSCNFQHSIATEGVVFTKAFYFLKGEIDSWIKKINDRNWSYRHVLQPKTLATLSIFYEELFKYLPSNFSVLERDYGKYLSQVVVNVFGGHYSLDNFEIRLLEVLKKVIKRSLAIEKNDSFSSVYKHIEDHLNQKEYQRTFQQRLVYIVIGFFCFIVMTIFSAKMNDKGVSNYSIKRSVTTPYMKGTWQTVIPLKDDYVLKRKLLFETKQRGEIFYSLFKNGSTDTLHCQTKAEFTWQANMLLTQNKGSGLSCETLTDVSVTNEAGLKVWASIIQNGFTQEIIRSIDPPSGVFKSEMVFIKNNREFPTVKVVTIKDK